MKKIMILGGGETQLPLIKASKDLGYIVLLCDGTDRCIGKDFVDIFYEVDIKDKECILQIAKDEEIDGIASNSEVAMIVVAYVSEQLGLVGNSEKSIECLNNKYLFRKIQQLAGVFAPRTYDVKTEAEVFENIKNMELPIIIKPTKTSGSRGVTKIEKMDRETIAAAYHKCSEISRNGIVNMEEYIEMPSRKVVEGDIFLHDGEFWWDGLFNTYRSIEALMVPMHYALPIDEKAEDLAKIKDVLAKIFKAADIRHGFYNVELYLTHKGEVFVIEINARQGGNYIPYLLENHTGFNMYKLLVSTAVGDNEYWLKLKNNTDEYRNAAQYIVFSRKDGILKDIYIDPKIKECVIDKIALKEPGAKVVRCQDASHNLGFISLVYKDGAEQKAFDENIEQYIYPIVEKE